MMRIGGYSYPLLSAEQVAPPGSMIYGGDTSASGGVYSLDEHFRNVGWCRGFDEFTETFNSLDPAWDVSELASAVISGGKLVTQGKLGTRTVLPHAGAFLAIPPIYGDFEISVDISWVAAGNNAMGVNRLYVLDEAKSIISYGGMHDSWAVSLGAYSTPGYSSGSGVAQTTGNLSVMLVRTDGLISEYLDGVLRSTQSNATPVCWITLTNCRDANSSYSGYVTSYDNLYVKRRR